MHSASPAYSGWYFSYHKVGTVSHLLCITSKWAGGLGYITTISGAILFRAARAKIPPLLIPLGKMKATVILGVKMLGSFYVLSIYILVWNLPKSEVQRVYPTLYLTCKWYPLWSQKRYHAIYVPPFAQGWHHPLYSTCPKSCAQTFRLHKNNEKREIENVMNRN